MKEFTEGQKKYHKYLQTDHWKTLRDFALFKSWRQNNGFIKCDECGKTGVHGFDVHHKKYPSSRNYTADDTPVNHVVLCKRCHGIIHDKIELSEREKEEIERQGRENFRVAMKQLEKLCKKKGI